MATIHDVDVNQLLARAAKELVSVDSVKAPEWAKYAKTGVHKERPPVDHDWWYIRSAAVLRSVYLLGPVGVSKLRCKYGGRKNRGYKPEEFRKGSGSVIRKVLQQLEKAELVRQTRVGNFKGRVCTPKGQSFLDKVASELYVKVSNKAPKTEKVEEKVEVAAKVEKVEAEAKKTEVTVDEQPEANNE